MTSTALQRFEGRVYAEDGQLHLVVAVDANAGTAHVSTRIDGSHQVLEVPLTTVRAALAEGAELDLKDMGRSGNDRVQQRDGGWYYVTREGQTGPFPTRQAAQEGLDAFLLGPMSAAS